MLLLQIASYRLCEIIIVTPAMSLIASQIITSYPPQRLSGDTNKKKNTLPGIDHLFDITNNKKDKYQNDGVSNTAFSRGLTPQHAPYNSSDCFDSRRSSWSTAAVSPLSDLTDIANNDGVPQRNTTDLATLQQNYFSSNYKFGRALTSVSDKKCYYRSRETIDSLVDDARSVDFATRGSPNVTVSEKEAENIVGFNNDYQLKFADLIETNRNIFEEIEDWPLAQYREDIAPGQAVPLLLDSISVRAIRSVQEQSKKLGEIAGIILSWKTERVGNLEKDCQAVNTSVSSKTTQRPSLNCLKVKGSCITLPHPGTSRRQRVSPTNPHLRCPMAHLKDVSGNPSRASTLFASLVTTRNDSTASSNKVTKPKKMVGKTKNVVSSSYSKVAAYGTPSKSRKNSNPYMKCLHCASMETPEWRRGPYGKRSLCNACGLFYKKLINQFGNKDANILMHHRRSILPTDRRVPKVFEVPESFVNKLEGDSALDREFKVMGNRNLQ